MIASNPLTQAVIEAMSEACKTSPLAALSWLANDSFPDPSSRSVATAAMVLTLGQLAGPPALAEPPGFLLVAADSAAKDPIDSIVHDCLTLHYGPPTMDAKGRDMARKLLVQAREQYDAAQNSGVRGKYVEQLSAAYGKQRLALLGCGRAGGYASRHDPVFGWGVDRSWHLIARLDDDTDRQTFLADARAGAKRLVAPDGLDEACRKVSVSLSVAGSIGAVGFDRQLVASVIGNALPILILPHSAGVSTGNRAMQFSTLANMFAASAGTPELGRCDPARTLLDYSVFTDCHERILVRSRRFPPDYAFFIERTLRELFNLCWEITVRAIRKTDPEGETGRTFLRTYLNCAHAILLSVETMVWHGYGIAGDHGDDIARLLRVLRTQPLFSKRDLLRKAQWLTGDRRDALLEILAAEGLAAVAGSHVRPATLAEFIAGIPRRTGIAPPPRFAADPARPVNAGQ